MKTANFNFLNLADAKRFKIIVNQIKFAFNRNFPVTIGKLQNQAIWNCEVVYEELEISTHSSHYCAR